MEAAVGTAAAAVGTAEARLTERRTNDHWPGGVRPVRPVRLRVPPWINDGSGEGR